MRHWILTVIAIGHCSLTLATICRADPSPTPRIELIAQAERILLVQAEEAEQFSDRDGAISMRTPLRLLWDLTYTAGKEQEPASMGGKVSIEWVWERVVVDSTGQSIVHIRLPSYAFLQDEIAVVYLQWIPDDSTREMLNTFVGEWKVIEKRGFSPILTRYVDYPKGAGGGVEKSALPMRDRDWEALVVYAADVLTLLGMDAGQAFTIGRGQIQALESQMGTTINGLTWGEIKARFRS